MIVNLPPDLTKYTIGELEKMLCQISTEMRPVVDELSKRYQQKKEQQEENLKKAS